MTKAMRIFWKWKTLPQKTRPPSWGTGESPRPFVAISDFLERRRGALAQAPSWPARAPCREPAVAVAVTVAEAQASQGPMTFTGAPRHPRFCSS